MPHLSPLTRSKSGASLAPSDTTYHSFHEVEIYEPALSSSPGGYQVVASASTDMDRFVPREMRRQDSGYESTSPRTSQSRGRRASNTSAISSSPRPRTRPSIRRSAKSGPVAYLPRASPQSLYITRSNPQPPQGFFVQFPNFQMPEAEADGTELVIHSTHGTEAGPYSDNAETYTRSETPTYPVPPQTTHYWTSDRTRRLEYAAIDAAGRGVKGWVTKHLVPDCFIPKSKRRMRFEDDRGSVVRYRLDLDTEESAEKEEDLAPEGKNRKSWWFSSPR